MTGAAANARARGSTTLADILGIEDTTDILALTCAQTGIAIWPQVRIELIRRIMADLLYVGDGTADLPTRPMPLRTAATMARSVLHNAVRRWSGQTRADILITTEAMADQVVDGWWVNRMADHFAALEDRRSLVLTDQHEWAWRSPRRNPDIHFHAPLQAVSSLAGRVTTSNSHRRQAADLAAFVAERAQNLIGWEMGEARQRSFTDYIARKLATTAPRTRAYERLLRHVRPKIVLNSSGCYGHIATMMAAANDAGIVTAEYQHGAISEGHDAYNFAPSLHRDERLLRILPRHFLSYGEWWSERINAPVRKTAIGYPERAVRLARLGPLPSERRAILFLSDGIEFDVYLEMAREVAAAVRAEGLDVAVRPHPIERTQVLGRWRDERDGPRLDLTPDIYASFASARAVVSDMSTGLFEAIGLVDQVIMLDSHKARFTYPCHPFATARAAQDVIGLIARTEAATEQIPPEALWMEHWPDNYRRFLAQELDGHAR